MHYNDTYCPLGILCEISGIGQWKEEPYDASIKHYFVSENPAPRSVFFPPEEVIAWAGLTKSEAKSMTAFVAMLNDGGASFKEIIKALTERYKIYN